MPVTKYVWDVTTDSYLMETDENDATTAVYTNEPGQFGPVISQRRGANSHFFHQDGLGSVVDVTDAAEDPTDSYVYRAYGEIVASTGSTVNPFRFVGSLGYYYDIDLLQYYIRARYYSPLLGRFLSRDPIDPVAGDANLYWYVTNRPWQTTDPSGLRRCCVVGRGRCRLRGWRCRPWRCRRPCPIPRPHPVVMTVTEPARPKGQCGGASFGVDIDVRGVDKGQFSDENTTGWVVQKVKRTARVYNCDGTRKAAKNKDLKFYEAFGPIQELPYTDKFLTEDEGEGTCGTIHVEAQLRWLPALDAFAERVPEGNWSWSFLSAPSDPAHVPEAGWAPTHPYHIDPNGWRSAGPGLRHALTVKWYCCGGRRRSRVAGVPSR